MKKPLLDKEERFEIKFNTLRGNLSKIRISFAYLCRGINKKFKIVFNL